MKYVSILLVFCMLFSSIGFIGAFADDEMSPINIRYSQLAEGAKPQDYAVYEAENADYMVKNFPSQTEKSLNIIPASNGNFSISVELPKQNFNKLVLETSVCYIGNMFSDKELFVLDNGEEKIPFAKIDSKGKVYNADGKSIYSLTEASFYRISLLLDFEKQTYALLFNNNNRGRTKFPKEIKSFKSFGININNVLTEGESFYIKYMRAYEGDKLLNDGDFKVPKVGDRSQFPPKEVVKVTDEDYAKRLSNVTFLTSKTNRARLNGEMVLIDETNPNVKPFMQGEVLMIPAPFASKVMGANLTLTDNGATFTKAPNEITFVSDYMTATKNGETVNLNASAKMKDGILYVPSDALSDAFGKTATVISLSTFTIITNKGEEFDLDNQAEIKIMNKGAREVIYEYPTSEEIIKAFKENTSNNHPRLFFDSEEVLEMREKVKVEPWKSWLKDILVNADAYLKVDVVKEINYVVKNNLRLLDMSRTVGKYVEGLGMAYILTGDVKYADKAIEVMERACDPEVFADWHPYHYLDTSEMSGAIAIGYDWCYDRLTPEQKAHFAQTMEKYCLDTIMEDYLDLPRVRTWKWSSPQSSAYPQNWVDVNFGGSTLTALAICDEASIQRPELVGDVIREGMYRIQDFCDTMSPDGVFRDGTGYWIYAHSYKLYGIDAMNHVLGTDYGLPNGIGFENGFVWLAQVSGPEGVFNFENNVQTHVNSSHFFWLARYLNKPEYNNYRFDQMEQHGFLGSWTDMVWYEPLEGNAEVSMATEMATRNYGNLVLRSGFGKNDTWLAAFTANPDNDSRTHQEMDGTFVLDMNGIRWAVDLGSEQGAYTGSLARIKYYRFRAEGHNTVLIQPSLDHNHNPFATGKLEKTEANDYSSYAIYDLTDKLRYKGCTSWRRGYKVDKETGNAMVQDELKASKYVEYYWNMHTEADITLSSDGRSAVLSDDINNIQILVTLHSDDKSLKFEKSEAVPLETSPQRTDSAESDNSSFRKLVVHKENVKQVNMAVEFTTLYGEIPAYITGFKNLDNWKLENQRIDKSLTLDYVKVDGNIVEGFDPTQKFNNIVVGLNNIFPEVTAVSSVGDVEITNATEENLIMRIRVKAKDGSGMFNDYIITPEKYDFYQTSQIATCKADYIGNIPDGYTKYEVKSVDAYFIPQAQNNPQNLIDGKLDTRYSVDVLGAYAQLDLGEEKEISMVGIGHPFATRNEYFIIATSNDEKTWDIQIENGTEKLAETKMQYFKFKEATNARYVRIYHCGQSDSLGARTWWSIGEVEILGNK